MIKYLQFTWLALASSHPDFPGYVRNISEASPKHLRSMFD